MAEETVTQGFRSGSRSACSSRSRACPRSSDSRPSSRRPSRRPFGFRAEAGVRRVGIFPARRQRAQPKRRFLLGLAKLNIWVSGQDDPCSVDNRTWYVTIYDCDGKVLTWCGRRYVAIPARCGHLEVAVPPGCYRISAVWSYSITPQAVFWGNHFTDSAIVCACCDDHVCVKLFNPSIHRCGAIFLHAVQDVFEQKGIKQELAREIEGGVRKLLAVAPRPAKAFELDVFEEIEQLARRQEYEAKDEPPPAT